MAKLPTFDAEDKIPEGLKDYYVEGEDGAWKPDIEGYVEGTKFAEFRDNNRKLNARVQELQTQVQRIEELEQELESAKERLEKGKDPEKTTELETQVSQLRQQLATLEQNHKAERDKLLAEEKEKQVRLNTTLLERDLMQAGVKAGMREQAIPDFVNRGKSLFQYEDGQAIARKGDADIYSKTKPTERLTIDAWIQEELTENAPHYWPESKGAEGNNGGRTGAQVIDASDPMAFGRNLEDIASGKVSVQ